MLFEPCVASGVDERHVTEPAGVPLDVVIATQRPEIVRMIPSTGPDRSDVIDIGRRSLSARKTSKARSASHFFKKARISASGSGALLFLFPGLPERLEFDVRRRFFERGPEVDRDPLEPGDLFPEDEELDVPPFVHLAHAITFSPSWLSSTACRGGLARAPRCRRRPALWPSPS